jgi:hypothetical protein
LIPVGARAAHVDLVLFSSVWVRILSLLDEGSLGLNPTELWEFAVEIYNGVVTTSASEEDKVAMVDLSIASLKRAVVRKDSLLEKTA